MESFQAFVKAFSPGVGGYLFMWAILFFFVLMVAIAAERMYYILVRSNINASRFMAEIRKLVINGDIKKAMNLCKAAGPKALPEVTLAALAEADKKEFVDYRAIQNAVDEATLEIIPRLTKRTHYLAMIANVATLMGLLGTIFGLIQAFTAVSVSGAEASSNLAAGISIAMITTYWGLVTAIPSIILYTVINTKTNSIVDDIDEHSVKLIHLLTGSK
ncbi:MAG: MotA/TolQ/ExbB proton channel family protein [Candidatus Zixiibacteriota bacterium]|nr:MAG: MotA/TolQ/ExbB proton channel family protein [candidate division Zixibacteria bacterium]